MPDWINLIRENLPLPPMKQNREERIIEELAGQFEDIYRDALSRGESEQDAEALVWDHIKSWDELASGIAISERRNRRSEADLWVERTEESVRDRSDAGRILADISHDLRYGLRRLRKRPGFTAVAGLTLALGIGATTAIFSLVDGVLLKPLPYPDSDRLVSVGHKSLTTEGEFERIGLTTGSYFVYSEGSRALESLAAYGGRNLTLRTSEGAVLVSACYVTHTLFPALRVAPTLGRAFVDGDDQPGAPLTVVLSHGFWQRQFGSDSKSIGRTMTLDDEEYEVIGVMPRGFRFPGEDIELWITLRLNPATARAVNHFLKGVGRLADGVTAGQATNELENLYPRVFERYPGEATYEESQSAGWNPLVSPLKEVVVGNVGNVLWVLMAAVGLILAIACANVANLFLVHAEGRDREIAVRIAMGANRSRLAQHFLVESSTLGIIAGIVGVGLAYWGLQVLLAIVPGEIPRIGEVGLNTDVLVFAAGISLLSGLSFGSIPVFRLRGKSAMTALKEGGRGGTEGRNRYRARSALVISQLAMALMLLAGSGLMLRTFWNLQSVDPGFRTENLLTFEITLPVVKYTGEEARFAFHQQALDRIEELPGVESATAGPSAFGLPLQSPRYSNPIWLEDFPVSPGGWPENHSIGIVMPGYFRTLGIPIVSGRPIERLDIEAGTGAVVVSEAFARHYWGDESPIGKRVKLNPDWPFYTIVGVARDTKAANLMEDPIPTIFWGVKGMEGYSYTSLMSMQYAVRTTGEPSSVLPDIRETIHELDANLPLASVLTMEETLSLHLAGTSFMMVLLGIAAFMALILGVVGVYGVMAYAVGQRTREIGIRMALGAETGAINRMILRHGLVVIGTGVILGIIGALAVTRLLESILFGVRPIDLLTFASMAMLLAVVALMAGYLPARRAAAVDPIIALRHE